MFVVRSKADLGGDARDALATSAATGQGLGHHPRRLMPSRRPCPSTDGDRELVASLRRAADEAPEDPALEALVERLSAYPVV